MNYSLLYLTTSVAFVSTLMTGCEDITSADRTIFNFGEPHPIIAAETQAQVQQPVAATSTDILLRNKIDELALTGDPSKGRDLPSINDPKVQLGKKLFFSKALSGNGDVACVSCHHPMLGGGDDLSLPIGVHSTIPELLGPGRSLPLGEEVLVPRNAPTTFNTALWDQFMFHDGRLESLDKETGKNGAGENGMTTPDVTFPAADNLAGKNLVQAQARFPITSTEEMKSDYFDEFYSNQDVREHLAARIGGYNGLNEVSEAEKIYWLEAFRKTYNQPTATSEELVTEQNISEAIGEYERSQVFVNTPWKQYVEGNNAAISQEAKQGALLFFRKRGEGGADCASCHSGDFFTDEQFYKTAMPQIGLGKENGSTGSNDYGRWLVTNNERDKFKFRTPSLINVEVTKPYGHSGAYDKLEDVVAHMLNPIDSAYNYDSSKFVQPNINTLDMAANTAEAISAGSDIPSSYLGETAVAQITAFLKTLTDPCVKDRACMTPWIPDASDMDPDGLMLEAIDEQGNLL